MNARDYLTLLRENKTVIAGCLVVCLLIAGLVTFLAPRSYVSSASYFVTTQAATAPQPQQNGATDLYQGAQLAQGRVKSYSELVTGPRVAADSAAALGGGITAEDVQSRIEVISDDDSVIFEVTATDGTPEGATRLLTAVSNSFLTVVRQVEAQPVDASRVVTQVVQPPSTSATPQFPKPALNLAIGLLVGLVVGFGVAILRRTTDVAVRSAGDLEYAANEAVLGAVPERAGGPSTVPAAGSGREAEAFRRIRTNVEFGNVTRARRVIILTSALNGEGKTTAACNLAAALSAVGARVVLVDGDVRSGQVLESLGWEFAIGLTEVIGEGVALDRALMTGTSVGFDVLPAGEPPSRPNELLSSRRTRGLIMELRRRYDYVLIDTPSLLSVGDAVNLGSHSDGAILVCRYGQVSGPDVGSAISYLRAVAVPVLGTILNRVPVARSRHRRDHVDAQLDTRFGVTAQPRSAEPIPRSGADAPRPARTVSPIMRGHSPGRPGGRPGPLPGSTAGGDARNGQYVGGSDGPSPSPESVTDSPMRNEPVAEPDEPKPSPRPHPVDQPTQQLEQPHEVEQPTGGK